MSSRYNPHITFIRSSTEAFSRLDKIKPTELGKNKMALKSRFFCFQVENLSSPACLILKQEMLGIGGECAIHQKALTNEVKEGKVILMGTASHYLTLKDKLFYQPFGLRELGEELVKLIENIDREEWEIETPNGVLTLGEKPVLMGILNVTPDSFYDGGRYNELDKAIARAEEMVEEGAQIIDIGGESTRPGSEGVSVEEELKRVMPVIEKLSRRIDAIISIDTQKSEVARRAVEAGAGMVNDISGLGTDPKIADVCASSGSALVLMHIKGTPKDMQLNPVYEDLFSEIIAYLRARIELAKEHGVNEDKIIVDPGIGFGKTVEHNLEIIRDLGRLKCLGKPILLGPSNKSFIGKVLDVEKDDRFEGTAASVVCGILSGAHILRVHDVGGMKRFVMMASAIKAGRPIF